MVKQQRRTDRCFVPAAGNSVTWVRFPVGPVHRRHLQQVDRNNPHSSITTEEERGDPGPDEGSGETKRARLDRTEEAAALTNREKVPGSCGQPGSESCSTADGVSSRLAPPDQPASAEPSEDSRAAELQSVSSLKVTIQQSSESREFGQTDRTADRQTGGLHCHVCDLTCRSVQVFQEHMAGSEHLRKLKEMTHSICLNTHTLQNRGCLPEPQRWCDTCQTHFSGDIIVHRRTKQHKMCKQMCRPFCPVCKRHFRTPRKFVEHMKSAEHKEQVHLEEAQEEELITVDAVGCFEGEEDDEEKEVEEVEVAEEEEEESVGKEEAEKEVSAVQPNVQAAVTQKTDKEEYDPHTTYGSSFVLPVSGFLCQLCNKFFYRETTARHTHCRTHTHYLNLQSHRAKRTHEDQDRSALT
ncbi:cdkn1a interacting zinc finger protein 1b [Sander lucioperca]|uniref:Cip1-interacting zinc finger protein-like n=1 Tax=Sander lucioperca TaxID=283035 RepID=A0A8C9XFE8_SANLU|nr:cdkn1a interacting zinc finger protein 1b [Sander lucioperca]XP_031158039.1 cdkn1a interacting zinc finger protein 1b [Sander lucioperca]